MPDSQSIKNKRRRFNALLYANHLGEAKPTLLESFGVTSTNDLSEEQLNEIIAWAMELVKKKNENAPQVIKEWRSKVLRAIAACGVNTQSWPAVNAFMLDRRIYGKHLYECTLDELQSLHRKLQIVAPNMKAQREREMAYAKLN